MSSEPAVLLSTGFRPGGASRWGSRRVLLSRRLLRLKHLDLSQIPESDRRSAARAQALAWAPFARSSYRLCVNGALALIVAWDEDAAQRALQAAGAKPAQIAWVPESLVQTPPKADGARLMSALEGVEGQYWRDGWLRASRWWPDVPSDAEWVNFLHGAAAPPELSAEVMPQPLAASIDVSRPWTVGRPLDAGAQQGLRAERWLVAGTGLLLVFLSASQLREAWDLQSEQRAKTVTRDEIARAIEPTIKARQAALDALTQSNAMTRLMTNVQPLDVLHHLMDVLPKEGVVLKEFDLVNGRLRLVLETSTSVSRASLVGQLQSGGWFGDIAEVQEGVQRGWLAFSMALRGTSPPASRFAIESSAPAPAAQAISNGSLQAGGLTGLPLPATIAPVVPAASAGSRP